MLPLRFVPYHQLGDTPNVVVDGGPSPSTSLTLSHWPGSPTPADLLDDLSAQIVFRALDRPALFEEIDVVSNNHFDQDGLASAYALLHPDEAVARRGRVIDVARAGDFGTFADRDSIRLAFALAAYDDPARSPLGPEPFADGYEEQCGRLYAELLPRFADLIDHPEASRDLWADEDAELERSLAAIASDTVQVEEVPAVDLAVVTVPEGWGEHDTTRFTVGRRDAVHPAAVNQATDRLRILVQQGAWSRLELRYETWVMFRSRPVLPRPDLRLLAEQLDALEPGRATWTADPPGALTPTLRLADEESGLDPAVVRAQVEGFLASADPAWDPYAPRR